MIYKITSSNTVLLVLILAITYFLLGIAGVALAHPPGYATEIFPPSGVAFVAVLYFGNRILPGVWLGSVAINIWVAINSGDIGVSSILVAMSIGVGASLQAWLASYLVGHVANVKWKYLTKKLDIIWFLLLAGPLASLISASWGNTSLLLSNTISSTEFISGWLDWWIGDVSGVILFAPLTLIVLLRREALWRIRQLAVAVPILLILVVIVLGYVFISQNDSFGEQQFLLWHILFVELFLTGVIQTLLLMSTGHYHSLISREKQNVSKIYESESRLKEAQAYAKIGYWELLADKKTALWSEQMYRLFGLDTEITPGPESLCDVVHENDFPAFVKSMQECFTTGIEHHVEYRIKRPSDGELRWIECRGKLVKGQDGKPEKISGFIQDITEHKLSKEKLQLSARVFSDTKEGILITDANKLIIDVNPAFCNITGYSREEVIGQNPSILRSGKQSPKFYKKMWQQINEQGHWQGEVWNRTKGGELYAELLTISELKDVHGKIVNYIGLFSDITHSKQQQDKLNLMAHYDVLTQLPNRALFVDRFQQATAHTKRTGNQLAVCFLDLDYFKPINDEYGHEVGDQLLISVAKRIKENIRDEDTVSRQGGDEFALLLGEIESFAQCEHFLGRLLSSLAQPYLINGTSHQVGASIGVTLFPFDDADLDTLLRHADQAMYQAKQAGRNRYQLFSLEKDQQDTYKYHRLDEIQQGLTNNEFQLYYQPKVNMATGDVFGAEALIRWNHPKKGLIPPLEFLPIIDGTALEIKIGNWVIEQALSQLEQWQAQGLTLEVSVNIASYHLQSPSFIEELVAAFERHPSIDHQHLQVEILESSALSNINNVTKIIKNCQDVLNINVALDDFGTGYSSLTHLKNLPANIVKIDQSFVRDILDDPHDFSIIDGVLGLSDAFNRDVIAEGVETTQHGLMLLIMGCHNAQGYGISKPIPADDFLRWFDRYQPNKEWIAYASKVKTDKDNKIKLFKLTTEQWLAKFETVIQAPDDSSVSPPIMNPIQCQCGTWIKRSEQEHLFEGKWLKKLDSTHQKIHFIANDLLQKYHDNEIEAARGGLKNLQTAFGEMSNTLEQCE